MNRLARCGGMLCLLAMNSGSTPASGQSFAEVDRAVRDGKTIIIPEEWTKTYEHWMTNILDWCISRQLWWGHRIPAWYCPDGHVTVSRDDVVDACTECGSTEVTQDEDVLDTWFSSQLWPFTVFGWEKPGDSTPELATTLHSLDGADNYTDWLIDMFSPHLRGDIVEIAGFQFEPLRQHLADLLDVAAALFLRRRVADVVDVERERFGEVVEALELQARQRLDHVGQSPVGRAKGGIMRHAA